MARHHHKKNQKGLKSESSSGRSQEVRGVVKRHPDGFGFLVDEAQELPDAYIPRQSMVGVMSHDRVRATVEPERGGERWRGKIEEILEHKIKRVVGRFHPMGTKGELLDESHAWGSELLVENPRNISVKAKDFVAVEITHYPDSSLGFRGDLVEVIGDIGDALTDSKRMLHLHQIPFEFSKAAVREAQAYGTEVPKDQQNERKDIRSTSLITIDGQTAKDFDDAIFVETSPAGFRLMVAIADVSHYVKTGSALDKEAYERGTSTYFPSFVAPMLPKELSDHLCSLRPEVDRLALVADLHFDHQGNRIESEFYEGLIKSHARVTYGEAQEVVDGRCPEKLRSVEDVILKARDLATVLMNRRLGEGSLDLDISETEIELDEAGEPVDVIPVQRLFAHRLIEEMMLAANVAVGDFLVEKTDEALFRIHEEPDPEAIGNLQKYLSQLGYEKVLGTTGLQKKMTAALQEFKGHPQEQILQTLTLRSMAQARYSPENLGHFGLGFENYLHFTSPIRRYPDLIVHRCLKSILYPGRNELVLKDTDIHSAGTFLSACEQRSVKAERQIQSIKKARFMKSRLGEEFDGLITSVARFGIFVMMRPYAVDGLIRLEELPGRGYEFDSEKLILVEKKSGRKIQVGDTLRVSVDSVDIEEGRIDLGFVEYLTSAELPDFVGEPPQKKGGSRDFQRGASANKSGRSKSKKVSSSKGKGSKKKKKRLSGQKKSSKDDSTGFDSVKETSFTKLTFSRKKSSNKGKGSKGHRKGQKASPKDQSSEGRVENKIQSHKKRSTTSDDRRGAGKARVSKSSRKNRSR